MSMTKTLDAILADGVARGQAPGVVALVADRDGSLYEGAAGERQLGGGTAMTPDTVVWIASMTKAITSVAAVQCAERGLLDLDAPAARVLPAIGELGVLTGFDAEGRPLTRPPKRPITLRHLLSHSAGCSYEMWNPDMQKVQAALGIPGIIECRLKALELPLVADPGERWEYGLGIDWAGRMVEEVSGLPLRDFISQNLLEPLGMHDSGFRITPTMRERLAGVHLRGEDKAFAPFPFELPQEPEFDMGGGAIYSTVGDYARFMRMVLNLGQLDGARVLKPETVTSHLMLNQIGNARVSLLKAAVPLTADAEFFPGLTKRWSLAFQINEEAAPTGRSAGSLSWAGLANSFFWIDPSTGIAGMLATQTFPFADAGVMDLLYAFEKGVYDALA
ncbi:serine hydrolase domain-containing protein [Variovorax sp. J31P207]|uniref:serine hydrolase domain-containing protein n=1 Tax=Variovorax sp. J31P207 TaxID=3053510 RepID=UPI002575D998|nr:serine hydrolase domain-containing protein [Variovorax sp. J31P207]MDM0065015.1 serine hydrolase domain-containing protein [Variovorax sp. J31P207]